MFYSVVANRCQSNLYIIGGGGGGGSLNLSRAYFEAQDGV